MKELILALTGIICWTIAIVGGITIGISGIAWSIYTLILLIKGTLAVSFWSVIKIVGVWIISPLCGWLWGGIFGSLGTFFMTTAKRVH
jgi:hypothetical protein